MSSEKINVTKKYEEAITELRNIIQDFQKGNLKLNDAVEKFIQSQSLLEFCKDKLQQFERTMQEIDDKSIQIDSDEKIDFEINIKRLDDICAKIERESSNMTLDQLQDIYIEGKKTIAQSKKELENFKHVIEYTNEDDKKNG